MAVTVVIEGTVNIHAVAVYTYGTLNRDASEKHAMSLHLKNNVPEKWLDQSMTAAHILQLFRV